MRDTFLVFAQPLIEQPEMDEVLDSMRKAWIGTGPKVQQFERDFAAYIDLSHAAALNSCTAALHLGRPFRFRGVVEVGDQRGRELGFPTANLAVPNEMAVPADGVYAGWLSRLDEPDAPRLPAAISVGTNPTFDGEEHRVESFVLDRHDLDLYGADIAVDFDQRIRGQVKFAGVDALIEQMDADVSATREALQHNASLDR